MAEILLLEPDMLLGSIYMDFLQDSGHTITHSKEAGEAIMVLDTNKIDLVILEIQIALHNGIEFLYEMRSYPDWQNIPVIVNSMVSVQKMEKNKHVLKQLNVSEILYKPHTSLRTLAKTVTRNVSARILS